MVEMVYRRNVLDHGHVRIIEWNGNDETIAHAARASFAAQDEALPKERVQGMIRFMMDNKHGSVFEHNTCTFEVKAPLVVFREWHRHRTQSYNEQSARYSIIPEEFYVPEFVRHQVGKPGAYTFEPIEDLATKMIVRSKIANAAKRSFREYNDLLDMGVAKEQARLVLPVNMYSQMWATANLRNWLKFIELRNSEHAMYEIRQYAIAIEDMLSYRYPVTIDRFIANGRVAP